MGIGAFDTTHPLSMRMLGMHGAAFANYAVDDCDFLIAVGARFDDRVAGVPAEVRAERASASRTSTSTRPRSTRSSAVHWSHVGLLARGAAMRCSRTAGGSSFKPRLSRVARALRRAEARATR